MHTSASDLQCNRETLAARALYAHWLERRATSLGPAAAAFKDAFLAFVDEPSPHNAGRYLAASERLAAVTRQPERVVGGPGRRG